MEFVALAGIALGAITPFYGTNVRLLLVSTLLVSGALVAAWIVGGTGVGDLSIWLAATIVLHQIAFLASAWLRLR